MEISPHIADLLEVTKFHKIRIQKDVVVNKMAKAGEHDAQYEAVFGDVSKIIDAARESAVRSVNAAMTAAYWLVGHRIVEFEQSGEERAEYGTALIERLAADLTQRFGRGFSRQNMSRAATKRTTVAVDVQGKAPR